MSLSPVSSILRSSFRKTGDKLNILTACTHARYETGLSKTNHNFYALQHESFVKGWHKHQAKQPDNYHVFDINLGQNQIPDYLDFDLVLSQNKFGQFQILSQIARQLQLPMVSLEHTLPVPQWPQVQLDNCKAMRGNTNVFISPYSIGKWEWDCQNDTTVIRHCVDTELFNPGNVERKNHILTICNDYIGRNWCLNFEQYQNVTKGLPVYPIGDTPGLSKPTSSTDELVQIYQQSSIFLNTAHISPIPTSLLEAMACLIEGEEVFVGTKLYKIEDLCNLETFGQNTLGNKIIQKHKLDYNDSINIIKCRHIPKFTLTKNHPVQKVDISYKYDESLRKEHKRPYRTIIGETSFVEAEKLKKNDYLVFPKYKTSQPLGMSKEWLRFYGLFLAEGCTNKGYIQFTFHEDELDLIEDIRYISNKLNKNLYVYKPDKTSKAIRVQFYDGPLAEFLNVNFFGLSHQKVIPQEFINASKEEVEIFLNAYIDGDGYRSKNRKSGTCVTTVSKTIAYQVMLMLSKIDILGCLTSSRPRKGIIKGREFDCKERYSVSFVERHYQSKKDYKEDENNFYILVTSNTKIEYNGPVYNLTTESHEFQVPFVNTHNCGNAVVSCNASEIPYYVKHNENGFLANDDQEMRYYLELLLKDEELRVRLGKAARETILEKCSEDRFVNEWDSVLRSTAEMQYRM